MYARLINILFRPEALPDVTHHFRTVSTSIIAAHPGFMGILASINRATGRIYLLTMWNNEENRDASAVHPDFIQSMASYGQWMAGGFNRESFEVIGDTMHAHLGDDPHAPAIARLTFVTVDPAGWDEASTTFRRLQHPDAYPESGFLGAILLANRPASKLVLIDLWETQEQIVLTDGVLFNAAHALRQAGAITAVPTHDVVEAVVRI